MRYSGICEVTENSRGRCKKPHMPFLESFLSWTETIVFTIFIVICLFTFVFRIAQVYGSSMMNTLYDHDKLLITNFAYEPDNGDIVVVDSEKLDEYIVKRVIGTAGQTVVVDYRAGTVSVDGNVLQENYIRSGMEDSGLYDAQYRISDGVYEYQVPQKMIFVMGDNRANSRDSRELGFISESDVLGHVVYRISSQYGERGFVK